MANNPDERRLSVEVSAPALLVLSENWFPGWKAQVDGNEEELIRANVTLSAVPIRHAGRHELVLTYTAPTVARASLVSLLSLIVTLCLWVVPTVFRRRPVVG